MYSLDSSRYENLGDSSPGNVLHSYCSADATNNDQHVPESDGDQDRQIRDRTNNTLITPRGGNSTMYAVIPIPIEIPRAMARVVHRQDAKDGAGSLHGQVRMDFWLGCRCR